MFLQTFEAEKLRSSLRIVETALSNILLTSVKLYTTSLPSGSALPVHSIQLDGYSDCAK